MLKSFVTAALLGSLWSPASMAIPPVPAIPFWQCHMRTVLRGVSSHYMLYGNDSWAARAILVCRSGAKTMRVPTEVTFNSLSQGFGADADVRVPARLEMQIYRSLPFQMRSIVRDQGDGNRILWQSQTDTVKTTVLLAPDESLQQGLRRSLRSGALVISTTDEIPGS